MPWGKSALGRQIPGGKRLGTDTDSLSEASALGTWGQAPGDRHGFPVREVPGGIELAPDGRAALIGNLNDRLDKAVKYPVQRVKKPGGRKFRRIKLRATIQHEAHALANRLLGRNGLPRIVESDSLFGDDQTDSGGAPAW